MNVPALGDTSVVKVERRAATPIAGAIAGILFAVLFGVSATLMTTTMSGLSHDTGAWLETRVGRVKLALDLLPFAGLFFPWFIAVARERLGRFEDRFLSHLPRQRPALFGGDVRCRLGGGSCGGLRPRPDGVRRQPRVLLRPPDRRADLRHPALRIAAIFLISQATLWVRTGVMPRWLALFTYALALVLLFIFTQSPWIILVFAAWVLMVSVYILVARLEGRPAVRDHASQPRD